MKVVEVVLLVIHVLAFSALVGGLLAQLKAPVKKVTPLVRDGAGATVVSGLLLMWPVEVRDKGHVNHASIGILTVIGVVILGLVMSQVRKAEWKPALYWATVVPTFVNVVVALAWPPSGS
jgi:hypothetical protein